MPFAVTWTHLETVTLNELCQRNTIINDIAYMWNLKNGTNQPIYKTYIESQLQKRNLQLSKRKGGVGADNLGDWN